MTILLITQLLGGLNGSATEQSSAGSFSGTIDFAQATGAGEMPAYEQVMRVGEPNPQSSSDAPSSQGPSREGNTNKESKTSDSADLGGPKTDGSSARSRANTSPESSPSADPRDLKTAGSPSQISATSPNEEIAHNGLHEDESQYATAFDYWLQSTPQGWLWLNTPEGQLRMEGWERQRISEELDAPMMIRSLSAQERTRSRELTDYERYVLAEDGVLSPEGKTREQMLFEHRYIESDWRRYLAGLSGSLYEDDVTLQQPSNFRRQASRPIGRARLSDISSTFQYSERESGDRIYRTIRGRLGTPGIVQTHRNQSVQRSVSVGTGYDAGHLLAVMFGAPGGKDNLGLQNHIANRYGTWKKMETEWSKKLRAGVRIEATVTEVTRKGEMTPFGRIVEWVEITPDGRSFREQLRFSNPSTQKSRATSGTPFRPSQNPATVYRIDQARRAQRRRK